MNNKKNRGMMINNSIVDEVKEDACSETEYAVEKAVRSEEVFEEPKEPAKVILYMSVTEYANFTGKSKSTIRRLIYSGKIFGTKKDDTGKWLIPINKEV